MKKNIILAFMILFLFLSSMVVIAENDTGVNDDLSTDTNSSLTADKTDSEITLMVYMCGSTLESGDIVGPGGGSIDIYEMCKSGFNDEAVNIILYAGGSYNWVAPEIENQTCGIYQILNGQIITLVNDHTLSNMGDPSTLSDFLKYSYREFPANQYALILWDHGGGALDTICQDTNFKVDGKYDGLTMGELAAALAQSPFSEKKLDWIGFDACLMSALETAKVVAPYAHYMVASEETEHGEGWDYRFLKGIEDDKDPAETGKRIVNFYYQTMTAAYPNSNNTMACIDLSMVSDLLSTVDIFFQDISVDRHTIRAISEARSKTLSFGEKYNCDLVDLRDMIEQLSDRGLSNNTSVEDVKTSLDKCVYDAKATKKGDGLSLYFPFKNISDFPANIQEYQKMDYSKEYTNFIDSFGKYMYANNHMPSNGSRELFESDDNMNYQISDNNEWNSLEVKPKVERDTRRLFTLKLSDEQMDECLDANFLTFQKTKSQDESELWRFISVDDDVSIDNGILEGQFVQRHLFVLDSQGEPKENGIPLSYTLRQDKRYEMPVKLKSADGKEKDAYLVFPEPDAYEIKMEDIEVYLKDTAINGYSPRLGAKLSDYTEVIFTVEERKMRWGENGVLLPYEFWEVVNTTTCNWTLNGEESLSFVNDYFDEGLETLYIAFEITDIFNNIYLSTPCCITENASSEFYISQYDDGKSAEEERSQLFILSDLNIFELQEDELLFSVYVTNISDKSLIYYASNIRVNGEDTGEIVEVYGFGDDYSLLPEEAEELSFTINIAGGKQAIRDVIFDLSVNEINGENLFVSRNISILK